MVAVVWSWLRSVHAWSQVELPQPSLAFDALPAAFAFAKYPAS